MHTIEYCQYYNLQVQLKQFADSFQDKPNYSINTLAFGRNKSEKMLYHPSYPATNASSERAFSTMNNRNLL